MIYGQSYICYALRDLIPLVLFEKPGKDPWRIFHELIPFLAPLGDKAQYKFLVTSECLLSTKTWGTVGIGSFCPKLKARMDQMGDHMKMNFDYFQMQKWMS